MSFPAAYFDGEDLRAHRVDIEVLPDGSIAIRGESVSRTVPAGDFRFSRPLARIPLFGSLSDGVMLEVPWSEAAREEIARIAPVTGRPAAIVGWLERRAAATASAVLAAAAAAVIAATTLIPILARRVAFAVPPSIEVQIGRASTGALAQISSGTELDWDSEARVRAQLDRLARVRPFHVHPRIIFLTMGQPNAFALPGGPIIVTDELLSLSLTDDEVAAVLAHELGHEELRHGLQQILTQSTALILVSMITGDLSTLTHFSGTLPALLFTRGYSRDFERQADAYAVGLLAAARIDPDSLATALGKLQAAVGTKSPSTGAYLSTHPSTPERIRLIRAAGDKLYGAERLLRKARAATLLNQAYESYRTKDFRDAVDRFRESFTIIPPDDVALYNAACASARAGDPMTALPWLSSAVRNGRANMAIVPADPALASLRGTSDWDSLTSTRNDLKRTAAAGYRFRAEAELARGDCAAAVQDIHREFEMGSKPLRELAQRGTTEASNGHVAEAVRDFSQAIALRPDDTLLYKYRALARLDLNPVAGISDMDRYLARVTDDPSSFTVRGMLKVRSDRAEAAIADFDRAAALNYDDFYLYQARGIARDVCGDFRGAKADLEMSLRKVRAGDDQGVYVRFWIYLIERRLKQRGPGKDLNAALGPIAADWTWLVARFLSGGTTEADFLSQASHGDAKTANEHSCEAFYYAAELRLVENDTGPARVLFQKCVATGVTQFTEYQFARAELRRIGP